MTALRFLLCETQVSVHVGLLPCSTAHSNLSRGSVCHTLSLISSPHPFRNKKKFNKNTQNLPPPSHVLTLAIPQLSSSLFPSPAFSSINCILIYFSLFLTQGRAQSLYPRLLILIPPIRANNKTTIAITTTTIIMTSPVNESAAPIMSKSRFPSLSV